MKKGLRALWSCNAFIGRTWGLSPKMALWLYKRVITPEFTYATVAWWDGLGIALTRSELERLHRAACIMITGAMRTTPTKVLEMFMDLPTLGTAVESLAQNFPKIRMKFSPNVSKFPFHFLFVNRFRIVSEDATKNSSE